MLDKIEKKDEQSKFEIIDSESVDTLESLFSDSVELEVIDLNNIPKNLNNEDNEVKKKLISPKEVGEQYKNSLHDISNNLLDPIEFLSIIESTVREAETTIQKLKEMQSKCSLGIVDLEHKLEFEELSEQEGHKVAMLIKQLSIYKRYTRDTLEKYNAISNFIKLLDISSTKSQIENINKIEKFHSERVYTPRIFNVVETKNYPAAEVTLKSLHKEIEDFIQETNLRFFVKGGEPSYGKEDI